MKPEWLTAISTIILAATATAAILRDEIRSWIRHPAFDVKFEPGQPDCRLVPLDWRTETNSGRTNTHYIRCRINNTGKIAAQDVEVAVVGILREDAASHFVPYLLGTPINLLWAHSNSHVQPQIPPGTERHVALGHIVDPAERNAIPGEEALNRDLQPDTTLFCLEVFRKSNTQEYLLDPGRYQITFEVAAANSQPKKFIFHLNHTGTWFEDEQRMYSDGIGLRITPS